MAFFLPPGMPGIYYAEANQVNIMWWISQKCEDKKRWLLFFNVLRMHAERHIREIYSHVYNWKTILSVCACAFWKYILLFRYQHIVVNLL